MTSLHALSQILCLTCQIERPKSKMASKPEHANTMSNFWDGFFQQQETTTALRLNLLPSHIMVSAITTTPLLLVHSCNINQNKHGAQNKMACKTVSMTPFDCGQLKCERVVVLLHSIFWAEKIVFERISPMITNYCNFTSR